MRGLKSFIVLVGVASAIVSTAGQASASPGGVVSSETARWNPGDTPKLYSGGARYYTNKALKFEFGNSYRYGYAKEIRCKKRISHRRMRCTTVKWNIGDVGYDGWTEIWYKRHRDETLWWHYTGQIKETNYYCINVGNSNCTEMHRF